ncbi:MAG: hypothetical protein JHC33_15195 [Ignisphaera sp.]|nr:hypothetical protein [Ignisphaera sp.]
MGQIVTTTTYVQITSFITTTTVIHDSSGRPITVTITRAVVIPTPFVKASLSPEIRASYEYLVTQSEKEPAKALGELIQKMPDLGSLLQKRMEMLKQRNQQQQAHQQTHQTARKPGLKPIVLLSE